MMDLGYIEPKLAPSASEISIFTFSW